MIKWSVRGKAGGSLSRVGGASIATLVVCASISACQRPPDPLAKAPIFYRQSPPQLAEAVEPPPPMPTRPEFQPFTGESAIYFEADSADLDRLARAILDLQADWLLRNPQVTASLQGHADLLGSREHQFAIGEMRAAAMRRYLVTRGVSPARLEVTSFGKQRPLATGFDAESQRLNRRGETVFRGLAGPSGTLQGN